MSRRLPVLAAACFLLGAGAGASEPVRLATYDAELGQKGPGVLISKIVKGDDRVMAAVAVIASVAPDVLVLNGLDWDMGGHALDALADRLSEAGVDYPHRFAAMPNAGLESGLDLDGNGRHDEARDAHGYGAFTGAGGMAVLSRHPLGAVRDFSDFLWADLPGLIPPQTDGAPFPSVDAARTRRLSSVAHWEVPVETPQGTIRLLTFAATTPVFDGPEDLNGRRNHDEIAFWQRLLDGDLPFAPPAGPVVVIGGTNLDPVDGEGRHEAMQALLADPRFTDPRPASAGGRAAANPGQRGDPALDTADWTDPTPGNLRVDIVLPGADLGVAGAGVVWPAPDDPFAEVVTTASRRRLVWVDVTLD